MKTETNRSELDSMIVEIELTLVSIIQGVALYFLIETARGVLSLGQMMFWPYVLAGLLVIFVFWSRSVLHIITVIRWPLEFGHNFLYIACALVEAILFSQLANPAHCSGASRERAPARRRPPAPRSMRTPDIRTIAANPPHRIAAFDRLHLAGTEIPRSNESSGNVL